MIFLTLVVKRTLISGMKVQVKSTLTYSMRTIIILYHIQLSESVTSMSRSMRRAPSTQAHFAPFSLGSKIKI